MRRSRLVTHKERGWKFIGDSIGGARNDSLTLRYTNLAEAPNGMLYAAPGTDNTAFIKVDPVTDTVSEISPKYPTSANQKYGAAVLAHNGCIYGYRASASAPGYIFRIDPETDTVSFIDPGSNPSTAYIRGVSTGANGRVYFYGKSTNNYIVELNPEDDSIRVLETGITTGSDTVNYPVLCNNGYIYILYGSNTRKIARLNTNPDDGVIPGLITTGVSLSMAAQVKDHLNGTVNIAHYDYNHLFMDADGGVTYAGGFPSTSGKWTSGHLNTNDPRLTGGEDIESFYPEIIGVPYHKASGYFCSIADKTTANKTGLGAYNTMDGMWYQSVYYPDTGHILCMNRAANLLKAGIDGSKKKFLPSHVVQAYELGCIASNGDIYIPPCNYGRVTRVFMDNTDYVHKHIYPRVTAYNSSIANNKPIILARFTWPWTLDESACFTTAIYKGGAGVYTFYLALTEEGLNSGGFDVTFRAFDETEVIHINA
jgi:hypothetical protein